MASFYLDVSAIGNEYQAYAATPTWGALSTDKPLPMDGNGKAGPSHSAAVAIAELQITALPADTNTLTIAGALLTAKTTAAAKNQWAIGGDIATCVTNLVALVNTAGTGTSQCDAATSTTVSALALALPYWQFARVKPGTTDTIQFATRIAGDDLNHATNSAVAITTSGWGTPPTITQFAGGVDGPFAYFATGSAVFGKAAHGYGVIYVAPASVTSPKLEADVVYVRTQRSASNLSVTLTSVGTVNFRPPTNEYRTFVFDNGATWAGDNGVFTWGISANSSSYQYICGNTYSLRLIAKTRGGLKINYTCAASSGWMRMSGQNNTSGFEMYNVEVEEITSASAVYPLTCEVSTVKTVYTKCDFKFKSSKAITYGLNGNVGNAHATVNNCTFAWTGIGANVTGIITGQPSSSYPINPFRFTNCSFTVDGGSYSVTNPVSASGWTSATPLSVSFNNCKGLTNPSAGVPASTGTGVPTFLWDGADNGRSFRYETMNYTLDWIDDGSYPYYNTQLASGSYMSHKLSWETARVGAGTNLAVGRYGAWFRDVNATKTVSLELLVPTAEIPTKAQFSISVKYTGSDGNIYYETTQEPYGYQTSGLATAIPDGVGTGSWTLNGVTGVSSKKLTITTTNAVKQATEITAELFMCGPPASNRVIYINPDLVLS